MSTRATSGRVCSTRSSAAAALPALPTTITPRSSSIRSSPSRSASWSSTIATFVTDRERTGQKSATTDVIRAPGRSLRATLERMAKDTEKLIRQLSLISYLMAERRPVTALEIRRDVEGYSGMNEDAFARRFYADRAELESLGIHLTVDKPI